MVICYNETLFFAKEVIFIYCLFLIFIAWNNDLGKRGEHIARAYLEEHGLFVLNRNWHCNKLEIDIIARKPGESLLHIVVVKTRLARNEKNYLTAAESVSAAKQRRLISASRGYLNYYNLNMGIQFDIIAVHFNLDGYEIEWIQDAFFPQLRSYH